MIKHLTY